VIILLFCWICIFRYQIISLFLITNLPCLITQRLTGLACVVIWQLSTGWLTLSFAYLSVVESFTYLGTDIYNMGSTNHIRKHTVIVFLRLQHMALFNHSCYKATIIPSLCPSCHSLGTRNMVTHLTTIEKHRFIWSVVSASYTANFLEGPHLKWRAPQMYWTATTDAYRVTRFKFFGHTEHADQLLDHSRPSAQTQYDRPYQGTVNTDQAYLVKLCSEQLNLMSFHLTLVWQLHITQHKIDRHGGRSWKRQHSLDKPHDDDVSVSEYWNKFLHVILNSIDEFVPKYKCTKHVISIKWYPRKVRMLVAEKIDIGKFINISESKLCIIDR